jgi:hypothetical protein
VSAHLFGDLGVARFHFLGPLGGLRGHDQDGEQGEGGGAAHGGFFLDE